MSMQTLTRNPTLLTALLSVAAVAGYLTYRFTAHEATPSATDTGAMAIMNDAHEHTDGEAAHSDALPDLSLNDLAGVPTSIASFAGKPLLINFWATWCAPCLREIPMLKAFHDENAGIDVLGIAVDRVDPVLEFAANIDFNYPVLVGQSDGMDAMAVFHNDAGAMPFSVFTAASGAVLATHAGELHPEHLVHFTDTLELLTNGSIDLEGARERMADGP